MDFVLFRCGARSERLEGFNTFCRVRDREVCPCDGTERFVTLGLHQMSGCIPGAEARAGVELFLARSCDPLHVTRHPVVLGGESS